MQGHCWVLADNADLAPPHVIDSRSFGPLPFTNILGRVAYSARSARDHGPVENSIQVRAVVLQQFCVLLAFCMLWLSRM